MIKNRLVLYLISFAVIAVSGSFAFAWTNPPANPPTGGGAISAGSGAPANAIRIIAGGNVGIGTVSPEARLQVNAPAPTAASLTWGATSGQIFRNENSELSMGLLNASPWPLWLQGRTHTNVARDIVINPLGGNVGIGTTAPNARLEVEGGIRINTTTTRPTCDASRRGTKWFTQSGANVTDTLSVCVKMSDNAFTWTRVVFTPSHYMIWRDASSTLGNIGGNDGADAFCIGDTNKPATCISGTERGLISASKHLRDIITITDIPFLRSDGALVANNKADLLDGSIAVAIGSPGQRTWSFSTSGGLRGSRTCGRGSDGSTNASGYEGDAGSITGGWLHSGWRECNNTAGIYCICEAL